MARALNRDDSEDEEKLSGSDKDEAIDEDMEALRRACILTGTNPNEIEHASVTAAAASDSEGDSSEIDDLELFRSIQQRFSLPPADNPPLVLKPLGSLPPIASDDDEDDFETLRAIQRRFAKYDNNALKGTENYVHKPDTSIASEQGTPSILSLNNNDGEDFGSEFPDSEDACNTYPTSESLGDTNPGSPPLVSIECHQPEALKLSTSPLKRSSLPESGQVFIDAIKKNRSCQKFIRSKLIQIEARIEENKKLKERIKALKDFQVSCRRRIGRALNWKKDAYVLLISVPKSRNSQALKVNDKKVSALNFGPAENSHVANYRMVLTNLFPLSLARQPWLKAEKENLAKGIKQQIQEMLFEKSLVLYSGSEGSSGDSNAVDNIIASITDLEITPENVRSFMPKVDWERLASMYVTGRSGAECEARWLNNEDPLINHDTWTKCEDKKLLHLLQERGTPYNWIDIASKLETSRTPYQCLARYQRSLNNHIIKRDWTEDDDAQLRAAVEAFGEGDWQLIASNLEGRTGTQCSNRWRKSLHPDRKRVGRWTVDEDKRLKVAVMLFGPKTWSKVAQFVPGRTQVQCRERWVNSLDPSLNLEEWTEDEDSRLKAAILEHGYCWSKVAASVPPRTDSQCRRRWKVLLPHEVPVAQAARKIQKAALISNFVDREVERPALGAGDFLPLPGINPISDSENGSNCRKEMKKSGDAPKKFRSKRSRTEAQICPEEVSKSTNGDDVGRDDTTSKKKASKPRLKKNRYAEPGQQHQDHSLPPEDSTFLRMMNGDIAASGGDDTSSKKKMRCKPHSKKASKSQLKGGKCAEPAQDHQHQSLPPEGSTFLKIPNGDVEAFGGDDSTSKKNKMVHKPCSKRNKCSKATQDYQCISLSSENPANLRVPNGSDVETSGIDHATSKQKKNAPKLHSKGSKCTEPTQDHQNLSPSPEHSTRIASGNDIETFGGDDTDPKRKKVPKPRSMRNKCTKSAQGHQDLSSLPEHLTHFRITNGDNVETFGRDYSLTKKRKAPKFCSEGGKCIDPTQDLLIPLEQSTLDSNDTSSKGKSRAANIPDQDRPKKSTKDKSCSKGIPETMDEFDVTLASVLNNEIKKRRLELVNKGNQAVSSPGRKRKKASELLSEGERFVQTPADKANLQCPVYLSLDLMDTGDTALHGMLEREDALQHESHRNSSTDMTSSTADGDHAVPVSISSKDNGKQVPGVSLHGNDVTTDPSM